MPSRAKKTMTSRVPRLALAFAARGAVRGSGHGRLGAPSAKSSCAAIITAVETESAPGSVGGEAR